MGARFPDVEKHPMLYKLIIRKRLLLVVVACSGPNITALLLKIWEFARDRVE
jgi:hypothetical protein